MNEDKSLVLVYEYKTKGWYAVYTVADTIERLAEISFRKPEDVTKILLGKLTPEQRSERIESCKPYALLFKNLTRKEIQYYVNQKNIETIVDEILRSSREINDQFHKWLDKYSFNKMKEIEKSLSSINVTGIKYGQLAEYGERGIEDILRH
ncbi:MAG: hypothetical protein AABY07_06630, partial [Nanoarchaeota archaeon]